MRHCSSDTRLKFTSGDQSTGTSRTGSMYCENPPYLRILKQGAEHVPTSSSQSTADPDLSQGEESNTDSMNKDAFLQTHNHLN